MLSRLTTHLTHDRQVRGLEITLQPEGPPVARSLTLSLAKGVVTVKGKGAEGKLGELQCKAGGSLPISLVLNGRGVLHKQVTLSGPGQVMDEQLLASVLPAVNPAEFYVQCYQAGGIGFFSLIRREALDRLLTEVQRLGGSVTRLSLGPFAFAGVWPFVREAEEARETVLLPGCRLELAQGGIVGYAAVSNTGQESGMLKIGEDEVERGDALAYAAALAGLVGPPEGLALRVEAVAEAFREQQQQKLFRAGAAAALVFFFLLLLGNFLAFSTLSERNASLRSELGSKRANLRQVNELEREAREKLDFLAATGGMHSSRLSFYADRLASTIPEDVWLTELGLNPADQKRSKAEGRQVFEPGTIAVRGTCKSPLELNGWIKEVKLLSWVARVGRQHYAFDNARGEGTFEFYIQLKGGQ